MPENEEQIIKDRIALLTKIILDLEFNEAFNHVVADKMETVKLCDDNWHRIDLDDKNKLLELKYAKISAQNMVDTISIYKQELEQLQSKIKDDQNYLDNYEDDKGDDGQKETD